MIVLDEQLMGRDLPEKITRWYPGAVVFVTDLRPNTIIKDEAIPALLQQQNQPTFITINERDFWRRAPADNRYCIMCFAYSDAKVTELLVKLREILQHAMFNTKKKRMGKVLPIITYEVSFYSTPTQVIQTITL